MTIEQRIEEYLKSARDDKEREALRAHALEPDGECDAEYCPWQGMRENLCARKQTHHPNCRCPDCNEMDDVFD